MKKRRESFTLIEMLVVITIIAILAGIAFKMIQLAKRNADRAKTVAKLEKVAHALNEYKAEYGIYPPVKPGACNYHSDCRVCYQYEDTNKQSAFAIGKLQDSPGLGNLFDFGLVAFLEKRDRDGIFHTNDPEWVPDTDRDEMAKERWAVFLEGVVGSGGDPSNNLSGSSEETFYINSIRTIKDAFGSQGRVIKYESDPPYLSYRLWSKGPDGIDGNEDDLHRNSWDN
jgi:prepilin-type N-terminal cleavage/methylation domain-containing protein